MNIDRISYFIIEPNHFLGFFLDSGWDFDVYRQNRYTRSRFGQPRQRAEDILDHSGIVVLSWHALSVTEVNRLTFMRLTCQLPN